MEMVGKSAGGFQLLLSAAGHDLSFHAGFNPMYSAPSPP
jgi:hypothetical protein